MHACHGWERSGFHQNANHPKSIHRPLGITFGEKNHQSTCSLVPSGMGGQWILGMGVSFRSFGKEVNDTYHHAFHSSSAPDPSPWQETDPDVKEADHDWRPRPFISWNQKPTPTPSSFLGKGRLTLLFTAFKLDRVHAMCAGSLS